MTIVHAIVQTVHAFTSTFRCLEKGENGKTCRKEFSSGYNLERHVEQFHRNKGPLVCGIDGCKQECHSKQALKTHQDEQHAADAHDRKFACNRADYVTIVHTIVPTFNLFHCFCRQHPL